MPILFGNARNFSFGFAAVEVKGKWGFIDQDGEMTIDPVYTSVGDFISTGLAWAEIEGSGDYRVIDRYGSFVRQFSASHVCRGGDNFLSIRGSLHGEEGYFLGHVSGEIYLGPYDGMNDYREGRVAVKTSTGWFLVDSEGHQYGEAWDAMESASEGIVAVGRSERGLLSDYLWGYIDLDGTITAEPPYNRAGPFIDDLALVAIRR